MRLLLALVAATLILAGCSADDVAQPEVGTIRIDDASASEPPAGAAGDSAHGSERAAATDDAPLDGLAVARPGTWPVGDAGSVTFDVVDGGLVPGDIAAGEGWDARTTSQEGDEIEVGFSRDTVRWEFEAEIDDGRLEIDLRQDHSAAAPGTYDLPAAGTFTFTHDGRLAIESIDVGEAWTVSAREEESDEFTFEVREGRREIDVEVEVDDGRVEVEIDYTVVGPLDG